MFNRARRRLTIAYIVLFGILIAAFSGVFLVLIAIVMQPDFDLSPDVSGEEAAFVAYQAAVQRIALALLAADVVAIGVVGVGGWILAGRTLDPIGVAHERQRRFVADASHEMRTPLTAIRATTDNSLRDGATDSERRAALATIAGAASELAVLTADLLTLAQADEAGAPARRTRFDLSVVIAERLALRKAAADPAPTQIRLASDLVVEGDPDEIARILDNLVDNAFRYGGPGVTVSVTTRAVERRAVLGVGDDGPGIAAKDQAHIFDAFYRIRADAGAPSGTGLGLTIAAALAHRNRGTLTLASEAGRGSTFSLALPLVR